MVADSLHWGAVFSSIRANKRLDSRLFISTSNMSSANEDWSGGSSSLPSSWFRLRAIELRLSGNILKSVTKENKDGFSINYRMQKVAQEISISGTPRTIPAA